MQNRMRTLGFSLIELLITLVIAGILAAIALPTYASYVQRGKITDATNQLATTRLLLEQYYQDNKNYGASGSACGNNLGAGTGDGFNYSCTWGTSSSNQSFIATATGTGSMAGFIYTIDNNNARTSIYPGASGTFNCWVMKSGESC